MTDTNLGQPAIVALEITNHSELPEHTGNMSHVLERKEHHEISSAVDSHEFVDSFHYAAIHYLTGFKGFKAYIFVLFSMLLIVFQIVALLGFQIRQQISFCSSDADCTSSGQYCELSVGLSPLGSCQSIHNFKRCFASSDCGEHYYCSTETQQTCSIKPSYSQRNCSSPMDCPTGMVCYQSACTTPTYLESLNVKISCSTHSDCGNLTSFVCQDDYCVQSFSDCSNDNSSCPSSAFCTWANDYDYSTYCSDFYG